jgi:hypothetical protein
VPLLKQNKKEHYRWVDEVPTHSGVPESFEGYWMEAFEKECDIAFKAWHLRRYGYPWLELPPGGLYEGVS